MSVDGNDSGSGGGRVFLYCCWRCVATLGKRSRSIGCSLGDSRFSASEGYVDFCGRSVDEKIYENKGMRGLSRYEDNATSQSC
jgi:hypothetical protein